MFDEGYDVMRLSALQPLWLDINLFGKNLQELILHAL